MKKFTITLALLLVVGSILSLPAQEMSFSVDSVLTTGDTPYHVVCADFDADSLLDLAVTLDNESMFDPLMIYLNDGSGKLSTIPDSSYHNTNGPRGLATGDLNNDQIPDLAVSIEDDSVIVILLGIGDGSFTRGDDVAVPTNPGNLVIADFDNDSNNDLAVVSRYSLLVTYKGNGQGAFAEPVTKGASSSVRDFTACDMNGDNYVDLLLGSGNVRSVGLYLNDGAGNFETRTNLYLMRTPWHLDVGDFNKDGYPDVAAGSGSYDFDNVFVLLADGQGEYTIPDTLSPGTYVSNISVNDYNNDKNPDLLVGDRNGLYILTGSGDGHFSRVDTIDYDFNAYRVKDVASVDIDYDGRIDLVVARDGQVSIYYNTGQFTSISDIEITPVHFYLSQNFPNPFNPSTTINYKLQVTNDIELSVYNLLGQKVATLVSGRKNAGQHHVQWNAAGFASGLYFYRLKTENGILIKKMQLVK